MLKVLLNSYIIIITFLYHFTENISNNNLLENLKMLFKITTFFIRKFNQM